jgi:hypothetical protein
VKRSLAVVSLVLLSGCATGHWEKPGATQAGIDADLNACSANAQVVPALPSPRTTSTSVEVRTTPGGVGVQTAGAYGDSDRQLNEAQRLQDCMRGKGYALRSD